MIGFKSNFTDTSVGESEQDANSALTELDKGLRSGKVGEQCEAIVRFPRLFEKYPFPILINSSFLKLSDMFRMGNNFLRLWVLRVCQQSEKHLDKILNVDEFLRRIFSVIHSNDPVARALTLRTLGAVAGIIPERQNVHHAIRRGLDSHDNVEVDAAIYATTRFAAHSNAFAVAMCNKVSDMVESENTDADRREKLVRALRTVHGGAVRSEAVLKLLQSLMERYPVSSLVRASISAITSIAADTVVHVPDQVEVLLRIVQNDPRSSVRRAALSGLNTLAEHAALWSPQSIQSLVNTACSFNDVQHTMACLLIMQSLVKCPAVCAEAGSCLTSGSVAPSLNEFCYSAAWSGALAVAATAAAVQTDIVHQRYQQGLPVTGGDQLMMGLESLVIATAAGERTHLAPLRKALRCAVKLSNSEPTLYASRTATLLGNQLRNSAWVTSSACKQDRLRLEAILEALAALGGSTFSPSSVKPAMAAVVEKMRFIADLADSGVKMETDTEEDNADTGKALVLLCTIVMQERAGSALSCTITDEWESLILEALQGADGWTRYRVARAALRYGLVNIASILLRPLAAGAETETTQRWLSALHRASTGDELLLREGISGLEEASAAWELAGDAAGTGVVGGMCGAWCLARAAGLRALAAAAAAARALCTQPPPAIAHSHAQASREPTARSGACALSLRKAADALLGAARRVAAIESAAFYADDATLRNLHISQHTYSTLSSFVYGIACKGEKSESRPRETSEVPVPTCLEEMLMLQPITELNRVANIVATLPPAAVVTHQHARAILSCVSACCVRACWPLAAACAASRAPAWRLVIPEPAPLPLHHHLALHLEGIIDPPAPIRKRQVPRQVKAVQLTVTVTPHSRANDKTPEPPTAPPIQTITQTVHPVRDFLRTSALVSAPAAGLYAVSVTATAVDDTGKHWHNHATTTHIVKVHEDPTSKGNTQNTRGRF